MQCEIESMAIFGIRGAVYARSHTNKIKRKKNGLQKNRQSFAVELSPIGTR